MRIYINIIIIFLLAIILNCCKSDIIHRDNQISLVWFKSYPEDTLERAQIGIRWILSYLGANISDKQFEEAITVSNKNIITVDIDKVDLNVKSQNALQTIFSYLKNTDVYKEHQCIDIGEFVFQTFNNSWHYYEITQAPKTLNEFNNKYNFDKTYQIQKGESSVASQGRLIQTSTSKNITEIAFLAQEGYDSSAASEFEVFDFMPNGQPKYAVYDSAGYLKVGSDLDLSIAGKPAKCMWCHESQVQPLFNAVTDTEGYPSLTSLRQLIKRTNKKVKGQHMEGDSLFFWKQPRDHSYAELLYKLYEEPTIQRLQEEERFYNISISIDSTKITANHEYSFLGLEFNTVIHRNEVNHKFNGPKFSSRESDTVDINLFK